MAKVKGFAASRNIKSRCVQRTWRRAYSSFLNPTSLSGAILISLAQQSVLLNANILLTSSTHDSNVAQDLSIVRVCAQDDDHNVSDN